MIQSGRLYWWTGVGVLVLTLGVYLQTMAPTVSFWDCGEFIACSYTLGVPHPPGSPLYVLLGRLFSLLPVGEIAARVVAMSALSSAVAAWCVYMSTVALARRALGGNARQPLADASELAAIAGGVVAALTLAFSFTQWFNATEAEVYGYSIMFTCLGFWVGLYWEARGAGPANDRWLFLLAYLFGLGGGLHMLCLLTVPSLLVLAWTAEPRLRRLIMLLGVLGVVVGLAMAVGGSGTLSYLASIVAIAAALVHLYRHDRRGCFLLAGMGLLFVLGYSTYGLLFVRSGLEPVLDMNDPQNWDAFVKFVNREQYGSESMLLTVLQPRASRAYQFWDLQLKYFFQQFPFPLLQHQVVFRKATEAAADPVAISVVPYLLGLWGLLWHGRRDQRHCLALAAMFVIMGFGLSVYLNMPDPQPRERHYVFGGMFYSFAMWMGLGWTGLVEIARQRLRLGRRPVIAAALVGLLVPAGVFASLYPTQNRTGDYIAYDYGYNLLESCDPNSILFTNGDNDTFPLWFLQEVEGVRRDVRVVNLSLLNTNWYIKQLRDREPKVPIPLNDQYIDSVLTDTQLVDLYKRVWTKSKVPAEFKSMGLDVAVGTQPGYELLRVQDIMVIGIIAWNQWQKPIHFAITIPASNRIGLDPYLRMVGMTTRLVPQKDQGPDGEALRRNLFEKYRFRGVADKSVYKDENASRLLGNYRACVLQLVEAYRAENRLDEINNLLRWADERIDFGWEGYYSTATVLERAGQIGSATDCLDRAASLLMDQYGQAEGATYDNAVSLGGMLLNPPYSALDRAEALLRRVIAREPARWDAYYQLAATLQAKGDAPAALALLEEFEKAHGPQAKLTEAQQILRQAMARGPGAGQPAQLQP